MAAKKAAPMSDGPITALEAEAYAAAAKFCDENGWMHFTAVRVQHYGGFYRGYIAAALKYRGKRNG